MSVYLLAFLNLNPGKNMYDDHIYRAYVFMETNLTTNELFDVIFVLDVPVLNSKRIFIVKLVN